MAHPDLPTHPFFATFVQALRDEHAAEVRAHREALSRSLSEQIAIGVRWPPLRVESVEDTWRGLQVVLRHRRALHEGIREGETVWVEHGGARLAARVLRVDPGAALLQVRADPEALPEGATVDVVRHIDPTITDRTIAALYRADQHESRLREDLLAGRVGPVPDSVPAQPPLDPAQSRAREAVRATPPLAVIHGPPGTGKTWLLGVLVADAVERGERVWALAESNAAVDHLAATLAARQLDVVRLGHPSRVRDDLQHLTVDARLRSGPVYGALKALTRDLSRCVGHDRSARAERRRLRRQLRELRDQARSHALSSASVVAATFGTLSGMVDRLPPADVAFVDEATQATEPSVWVAVPHVDRLVLVGDPEQLGPVVKSPGNPLEHSALHRIVRGTSCAAGVPMLEVQHRMSEPVQTLVGPVYGPCYRPAPAVAGALLRDLPGIRDTPLTQRAQLFVDTAGTGAVEERDSVTHSLRNEGEARLVERLVEELREAGVQPEQVGVAAPYSAQVARLRASSTLAGVEVASINAFQGRERPVMILSWVRANNDGALGFVADDRRITVAWSRARCLLLQVGDLSTLSTHPRFAEAAERLGPDVESAWNPPWADVLGLY